MAETGGALAAAREHRRIDHAVVILEAADRAYRSGSGENGRFTPLAPVDPSASSPRPS